MRRHYLHSEGFVKISATTLGALVQKYPHASPLLEAFVPLLEARETLAQELPAPLLPPPNPCAMAQGKPWLAPTENAHVSALYLDDMFMTRVPQYLLAAARKGMPQLSSAWDELDTLFSQNPKACRNLVALGLLGKRHRTAYWAKKNGQDKAATALICLHLAATAARRVAVAAQAAQKTLLEAWTQGHCPVCGGPAHAGFLQHKEGQRFIQCGLCGQTWRFSRTVCPLCADDKPEGRTVFFYQGDIQARAEACESCKSYMQVPDMRDMAEEVPLELLVLCLMPLDLSMQEKGYTPASLATIL